MNKNKYLFLILCITIIIPLTCCNKKQPQVQTTTPPTKTELLDISGEPVRFGVLTIDSAVSVNERYTPLLNYLSKATGRPFKLVPLTQKSQFTEVEKGNLDFVTNNPLASVQIRRLYNTKFLVTNSRPQTGAKFSGLIIVNSQSDIKSLADLRGKKGACVNFQTAAAGCTFQIYHLQQKGIDPFTDFSSFVENKSQDNIVLAVLNGTIDVGFIRTGQLQKMLNKGLINSLDEVRIIDPASDQFFYNHTTDLYPEWPIAALENTEPELALEVKEALLDIPRDHAALKAVKLQEFVPAVDYSKIDNLIESLKLKTWDAN